MTMGQALTVFSFQHTAARRRLEKRMSGGWQMPDCFNTQPPEGGWLVVIHFLGRLYVFQHTAARRRLDVGSRTGSG